MANIEKKFKLCEILKEYRQNQKDNLKKTFNSLTVDQLDTIRDVYNIILGMALMSLFLMVILLIARLKRRNPEPYCIIRRRQRVYQIM